MTDPIDHVPLVFLADVNLEGSCRALREAVSPDLYARAIHARVTTKSRFIAILLGPSGGRAVIPLAGPGELLDFQRVLADLTAAAGAFEYVPLELDDETARELCGDLALRTLGDAGPEGHG